ncbi:F0F1 ATP synthase subunit delta [Legionella fairfieldensis]|uniref:F0F1 ATP synthase subunit delta n=1 Tax=Legionella fairfieldensis TaxID=45064 RepID=UPI00048BF0C2|nr:F0F1 ATP synthase subunit delta [Legionella fairfieldensis]
MADTTTMARPYAKAIFEHALAVNKLGEWSDILHTLAVAVLNDQVTAFIRNPATTQEQQVELFKTLFAKSESKEKFAVHNLIALLASNKRLMLLPDLKVLFEALRAEQEKTLKVKVTSFSELSKAQQDQLINSLSKRLQRKITLDLHIDKSLLGGAIVHADDLVIDGSVRGKLNKLSSDLAA